MHQPSKAGKHNKNLNAYEVVALFFKIIFPLFFSFNEKKCKPLEQRYKLLNFKRPRESQYLTDQYKKRTISDWYFDLLNWIIKFVNALVVWDAFELVHGIYYESIGPWTFESIGGFVGEGAPCPWVNSNNLYNNLLGYYLSLPQQCFVQSDCELQLKFLIGGMKFLGSWKNISKETNYSYDEEFDLLTLMWRIVSIINVQKDISLVDKFSYWAGASAKLFDYEFSCI